MEDLCKALQTHLISAMVETLIEEDRLEDFLKFGREKAKEDGMDTEELMKFFDELENEYCDNIQWKRLFEIVNETTNRKVMGFQQDKCIIIENKTLTNDEVEEYMKTKTAPIHLDNLNKALESINIKLEFIEAISNPFEFDGYKNFVGKSEKLDAAGTRPFGGLLLGGVSLPAR